METGKKVYGMSESDIQHTFAALRLAVDGQRVFNPLQGQVSTQKEIFITQLSNNSEPPPSK